MIVSGKAPTKHWTKAKKGKTIQRKLAAAAGLNTTNANLVQRQTASGQEMSQRRDESDVELQRLDAFNIIMSNRSYICSEAVKYTIPTVAIAGAIFWEALNP